MKKLLTFYLVICLLALSLFAQSSSKKDGHIFIPAEPCYMAIEELPPILGLHFGMKIDEVKKIYKTTRNISSRGKPSPKVLLDIEIYEIRSSEITRSRFKSSLQSVEFIHQTGGQTNGITSISLNFRPPLRAGAYALFEKITDETGLPGNYWLARDFGSTNYLQWDARCDGFSASVVIQPGFFARLNLYPSFGERQKRKPRRDEGPVGD